jgi:hypothetical protein
LISLRSPRFRTRAALASLALSLCCAPVIGADFLSKITSPGKGEQVKIPFRWTEVVVSLPVGGHEDYRAAVTGMKLSAKFAQAEEKLSTLVAGTKVKPEYWLALAVALEAQGKLKEARNAYEAAHAKAGRGSKITDECEAGIARLDARAKFAGTSR